MRLIIFIAIIGWIVSSCNPEPTTIFPGYYHFNDETNSKEIATRTLRLEQDSTFVLWGFIKRKPIWANTIAFPDSVEFSIYLTWGYWLINGRHLIIKSTDDDLRTNPKWLSDDDYFDNLRKWNYEEQVGKINDTFLIQDKGYKLKDLKEGITLEHMTLM